MHSFIYCLAQYIPTRLRGCNYFELQPLSTAVRFLTITQSLWENREKIGSFRTVELPFQALIFARKYYTIFHVDFTGNLNR